jgi:ABC-type multidrug transport system fused ATPase/permease subunit
VLGTFRRAVRLLDPRARRGYLLAVPAALVVMCLELAGFVGLAAVVQVMATPTLLDEAGPNSLVGVLQNWVQAPSGTSFVGVVGGIAVGVLVLRGVAATALSWWQAGLLAHAEAALSSRLFRAYMGADYGFHLSHHSADLIRTVVQSVRSLMGRVLQPGVTIITEGALVVGLATALLVIQPLPALTSIVALIVAMTVYLRVVRGAARSIGRDDERFSGRDQRIVQEGLGAVKVLTILERREPVVRRFEQARAEHANSLRGLFFMSNVSRYYLEAVILLIVAGVTATALFSGEETVLASIGVLLAGSMRLLPSVQRLATAVSTVQVGLGSVDTVEQDLLNARERRAPLLAGGEVARVQFTDAIRVRQLSYRYPGSDLPALDSVDVVIGAGESVGIVGASGSGKTTFVDVLTGLLLPTSGEVTVDGRPITQDMLPGWRAQIGYVPQETVIIDDTVRRNVALGLVDEQIDDEAVARALDQAQLTETVASLPQGMHSALGERGVRMSGGQRQRIGIARALYSGPRVLVLDEATAALDSVTERQITDTIDRLQGQLTIVVIAHRLTTVERCDRLVVLSGGRVEAIGTYAELQQSNKLFSAVPVGPT